MIGLETCFPGNFTRQMRELWQIVPTVVSSPGVGGRLPLKHDGIHVYDENCINDRNYGVFYTSDMGGYIF